jgi:predicted outer membrane repeat protein
MRNNNGSEPTVTGGSFTGNSAAYGGGMYNTGSSPAIIGVSFAGNTADYGGGMRNNNGSEPTVTDCSFAGNAANTYGGAIYNTNSSPEVRDSSFANNTASNGAGMYNTSSSPVVVRCSFRGGRATNNGGGIYNTSSSSPLLLDDVFSGNHASDDGGAISSSGCTFRIVGSVFEANRSGNTGGALFLDNDSSATLVNCTLTGNQYGSGGFDAGIIRIDGVSSLTLRNTIIWNAGYTEIDRCGGFNPCSWYAYYSDVRNGTSDASGGSNNMQVDPELMHLPDTTRFTYTDGTVQTVMVSDASSYFGTYDVIEVGDDGVPRGVSGVSGDTVTFQPSLDAASVAGVRVDNWGDNATDLEVDLRLESDSPCIDAAQDSRANYSDIEGLSRVDDGTPDADSDYADMGAHEFGGYACDSTEVYDGRIYWPGCAPRTWTDAQTLCEHFNGDLASIDTSTGENDFVQGLASGVTWIGGHDQSTEGSWEWSDGESWSDPNWSVSPGQPDGSTDENCAALSETNGTWSDEVCDNTNAFVCERSW